MQVLVTGGAGFIGSHLAEHWISQGHEVWAIDDLSTGSVENISAIRSHPRFHFQAGDVMERSPLAELVDRCDVIYHLAAAVGVKLVVESPVRTIRTNVGATELLLELASKKRKMVVIASTSEVYGKSTKIPFCEEDDLVLGPTTHGRWSYACSKAIDEFLALAYWREKRLPVIVARLFNTVGARQTGRYGMVLPNFVSAALRNEPIRVFGTGTQSRCFADVRDVVRGLASLALCDRAVGEVFNIGNDQECAIEELARRVRDQLGSTSPITNVPYELAYGVGFEDMMRRVPSLKKIEGMIAYRPSYELPEIIERVADYLRPRMSGVASISWSSHQGVEGVAD
ncbi:MAG: NAD-dependent epimerase/dehydratase family protein [Candidatus Acidiferrales bacterium]